MSRSAFRKVSHVIFDMDGLLLDTEKIYTQTTQKILDKYGDKVYTWDVKVTLMGLQTEEVSRRIVDLYELPITWQEYAAMVKELNEELMKDAALLPDTEPIYERMVGMIAKEHGHNYPKNVRMKVMGTTEKKTGEIVIEELKLPINISQFLNRLTELSRVQLQSPPFLRGAERLVRHLHKKKVPFALATSSGKDMVEVKTQKHLELFELFNHKVMGSTDPDVKEGKPAPDIFLVAAGRFPDKPAPDQCLVFEDAPNGVRAANLAGMQVVMVPDEHMSPDLSKEATVVLKSLLDFKPEQFGLPPFDDAQ